VKSQVCSLPGANVPANLVLLDQSSSNFYRRSGVIGGVNASIHVAILPYIMECQRTEWRWDWGMPIFADSRQKSVTIAKSLVRSRKRSDWSYA